MCIDSSTDIITVMIELIRCAKNDVEINRKSEYCDVVDVNIAVMILDETGVQKKSPTISRNRSENSINFKIEKIVGIYVFILTSTTSIDLNFLLVRNQLTHILPLHNNLFTHEGIF